MPDFVKPWRLGPGWPERMLQCLVPVGRWWRWSWSCRQGVSAHKTQVAGIRRKLKKTVNASPSWLHLTTDSWFTWLAGQGSSWQHPCDATHWILLGCRWLQKISDIFWSRLNDSIEDLGCFFKSAGDCWSYTFPISLFHHSCWEEAGTSYIWCADTFEPGSVASLDLLRSTERKRHVDRPEFFDAMVTAMFEQVGLP